MSGVIGGRSISCTANANPPTSPHLTSPHIVYGQICCAGFAAWWIFYLVDLYEYCHQESGPAVAPEPHDKVNQEVDTRCRACRRSDTFVFCFICYLCCIIYWLRWQNHVCRPTCRARWRKMAHKLIYLLPYDRRLPESRGYTCFIVVHRITTTRYPQGSWFESR